MGSIATRHSPEVPMSGRGRLPPDVVVCFDPRANLGGDGWNTIAKNGRISAITLAGFAWTCRRQSSLRSLQDFVRAPRGNVMIQHLIPAVVRISVR
jgi:hypothetical protein